MRLLFDQNLSPKLVSLLIDIFPDSTHVQDVSLDTADDLELWEYARDNDFLIVSKDADFSDRSMIYGYSPKVIWLRLGNCSTNAVARILRNHYSDIRTFADDLSQGLLILL